MREVITMGKEDIKEDVDVWSINLEGQICVLKLDALSDLYKDAKFQLVKCTGGFGCNPTALGNAIFVKELYEGGEAYRRERRNRDFLGVATDKAIKEWESIYGKIVC